MNNDLFIIDSHIHLGYCPRFYTPNVSLHGMINIMDKNNIKWVCGSHIAGVNSHHFEYAHIETLKAIKEFRGRVYGYVIYDPIFPNESLESVKKYLSMKGFIGIKIYPPSHRHPIDGEGYEPIWKHANKFGIPVLTHTWDATPQDSYPYDAASIFAQPKLVGNVKKRYPQLKIIMAHGGSHYNGHLQAIEVVKKYENVYVDTSGDTITFGLIEWFVNNIGTRKILYGSDLNWVDPRAHIGRVIGANINIHDKELILCKNAYEIFNFNS